MLQNPCKTLGFKKKNGLQNSPWGGGRLTISSQWPISYLPHVVNTCIINVIVAYALSTHQNRLSETALVCIWNILSIDISHTKCFIAPHVLTEIITY